MVDQEAFLSTNVSKLNQQLEKQRRKNLGLELELMMAGCKEGMDLHDLKHIKNPSESIQFLEEMIASVTSEIEHAENENNAQLLVV